MAHTSWILLGCTAVLLGLATPIKAETDSDAVQPKEETVKRVARSFGDAYNDLPGLSDPRLKQMIDWNMIFNKRSGTKRSFGSQYDGTNHLGGYKSLNSPNMQDWTSSFGRSYRSFDNSIDNSIPNFGGGLQPNNMQNWQNFVGRMRKREFGGGDSGSRRLGEYNAADLQNWRNFFQRGARQQ